MSASTDDRCEQTLAKKGSWALQQRPVLTDFVSLGVVLFGQFKRLQLAGFDYLFG